MFRTKVVGVLVAVFFVSAALLYWRATDLVESEALTRLEQRLQIARRNLERVRQLRDYAVVARAEEIAETPATAAVSNLAKILSTAPATYADEEGNLPNDNDFRYKLHQAVNKELGAWTKKLEAQAADPAKRSDRLADQRAGKPDLFRVVDAKGIGIASTHDLAWFGERDDQGKWVHDTDYAKQQPAVKKALEDGRSLKDLWMVGGAPMTVSVAPIRKGTAVVGAVVLGFRLTDSEARRDKALVDADVAYFVGDHLSQTSSLGTQAERAAKKVLIERGLNKSGPAARGTVEFVFRGDRHVAVVGALSGYATAPRSGFLAIGNYDTALDRAWGWSRGMSEALPLYLWLVPLFGMLISLGLFVGFFEQFMKPFDEIDRGVLEILNGDLDYWFEIPGKDLPGTMSQNLNIMVCHLSGRPLPEDEDAVGGEHWAEERMFVDEIDSSEFHAEPVDAAAVAAGETAGLAPAIVQLVREDEESYLRRTFREYTQGLQQTGEPVQGITYEKFSATLTGNADALREKFGCASVRFVVAVGDDRVSLKPIPIT